MQEILLCSRPFSHDELMSSCGISTGSLMGTDCQPPRHIRSYSPYLVSPQDSDGSRALLTSLAKQSTSRSLTDLALSFGGDNTVALSQMSKKLMDYNVGMLGASTSIYANRLGGFAGAVKEYQGALMGYRQAVHSGSSSKVAAKLNAQAAFTKLQSHFRLELGSVNAGVKAKRGTPLTSVERATNIARSSRDVTSLRIADQAQARNLVKFTQHAKLLGNGLAVIDFGGRIGNIHNSYQTSGEWERELFIESSSFAASAATGIATAKVGAAALTLLVAATPVGWVGLVIGGAVVAGAAAAATMGTNHIVKEDAGGVYDKIMSWIGS